VLAAANGSISLRILLTQIDPQKHIGSLMCITVILILVLN
jgi:hypothetical protein